MRTLYEKIEREGFVGFEAEAFKSWPKPVIILIDNVANYVENQLSTFGTKDVPNAVPPFEDFWMEYSRTPEQRVGFYFHVTDDRDSRDLFTVTATMIAGSYGSDISKGNFEIAQFALGVPPDGRLIGQLRIQEGDSDSLAGLETEDDLFPLQQDLLVCLLAISFMHCRNVELVERGPHTRAPGTRNRRGPRIKYYTLEIEPMKRVLRTEGQSETTGLKRALHICRGHFAHYTAERRLFGKYEGTFWHPMHVRGSKDAGEVIKDYKIGKLDGDANAH